MRHYTNLTLLAERITLSGSKCELVRLDARCVGYKIKSEVNVLQLLI